MEDKPNIKVKLLHIDGRERKYRVIKAVGYSTGYALTYKVQGRKEYCYVRKTPVYPDYRDEDGFKIVGQIEGNVFAVGMWGHEVETAPGEEFAVLLRTDASVQHHKTIHGKGQFPWLVAIIAVAIIVGAFIAYQYFKPDPVPANNSPGITTTTHPSQQQTIHDNEIKGK